ncbi:hypothetical protein HN011_012451 [Eciton burchellii]|nr:hypothetical protein HN011_012451 [Eciton burchellii]
MGIVFVDTLLNGRNIVWMLCLWVDRSELNFLLMRGHVVWSCCQILRHLTDRSRRCCRIDWFFCPSQVFPSLSRPSRVSLGQHGPAQASMMQREPARNRQGQPRPAQEVRASPNKRGVIPGQHVLPRAILDQPDQTQATQPAQPRPA